MFEDITVLECFSGSARIGAAFRSELSTGLHLCDSKCTDHENGDQLIIVLPAQVLRVPGRSLVAFDNATLPTRCVPFPRSTYDKVNDPICQDLTTLAGFLGLIKRALRLKPGGLLWLANPCHMHVWMSSSVHQRGPERPWGDVSRDSNLPIVCTEWMLFDPCGASAPRALSKVFAAVIVSHREPASSSTSSLVVGSGLQLSNRFRAH